VLVGRGEFQVLGAPRDRLQQLDPKFADAPPTSSTVAPSMPTSWRNGTIVRAVLSSPRFL
jgi:hypothetical protein